MGRRPCRFDSRMGALRCRSIWPGAVTHAVVNPLAFIKLRFASPPSPLSFVEVAWTLGLAFGLLALAAVMELRWRRHESARSSRAETVAATRSPAARVKCMTFWVLAAPKCHSVRPKGPQRAPS